ncbi:MAG: GntR family transcriptional regulator [Actinomycetes bacterium]
MQGAELDTWVATVLPTDEGSPEPKHRLIAAGLARAIAAGTLATGQRLPAERDLAAALGVSRMTLRQALDTLESTGLLRRVRGRQGGSVVLDPLLEVDLTGLLGFSEHMRRIGVRATARVVLARTVPGAATVTTALGLVGAADVHELVRVRVARGQPVLLEHSYLPAGLLPGLLAHRLDGSLYALLRREYHQAPCEADESFEPVLADPSAASALQVAEGWPLMCVERLARTSDGTAIEYARDLFRPDRVRLRVHSALPAEAESRLPGQQTGSATTRAATRRPYSSTATRAPGSSSAGR